MSKRIHIKKTYKLYIDGKFPRTESGRYIKWESPKDKTVIKEVYSGKDIYKVSRFYRSFSIINYLLFGVSNKN